MRAVKGSFVHSLNRGLASWKVFARVNGTAGKSIAKQSEGRAGEKYLPVGGRVRKSRAVEDHSAPIPEERTSKLGRINLVEQRWSLDARSGD